MDWQTLLEPRLCDGGGQRGDDLWFHEDGRAPFLCKHLAENPASARVIRKLGFRYVGNGSGWCEARQCELPTLTYERRRPWTMSIRALAT